MKSLEADHNSAKASEELHGVYRCGKSGTQHWRSLVSPVIDQAFLIYTTSRVKEGKTEEQTNDRLADQWAKNKKETIKL